MAEPIRKISTSKYNKQGKVEIDGHIWTVRLPGAGTELGFSQALRWIELLDKKIASETQTEEDLEKYDRYEKHIFETFKDMFTDDTEDNSEVRAWLNDTPLAIIVQVFEDLKEQANGQEEQGTASESS